MWWDSLANTKNRIPYHQLEYQHNGIDRESLPLDERRPGPSPRPCNATHSRASRPLVLSIFLPNMPCLPHRLQQHRRKGGMILGRGRKSCGKELMWFERTSWKTDADFRIASRDDDAVFLSDDDVVFPSFPPPSPRCLVVAREREEDR
jgi:hypothetical protein